MTISELKKEARVKLEGKWIKAILITIVYLIIIGVLEMISALINNNALKIIYSIAIMVINLPFSYGLVASMIKLSRNEEVGVLDFITLGLQSLQKVWSVFFNTFIRILLSVILFFVAICLFAISLAQSMVGGEATPLLLVSIVLFIAATIYYIVKLLSYQLTSYILYDNQDATGKEIVLKSAELMKGNKWKYIGLGLSFIGWYLLIYVFYFICAYVNQILAGILIFVGVFLLSPYISISTINFYEDLADVTNNQTSNSETTNEQ